MRAIKLILCVFNIHNWEIHKWSRYKDVACKKLSEEGFDRECKICGKKQRLERPINYHPIKYVWTDIIK